MRNRVNFNLLVFTIWCVNNPKRLMLIRHKLHNSPISGVPSKEL